MHIDMWVSGLIYLLLCLTVNKVNYIPVSKTTDINKGVPVTTNSNREERRCSIWWLLSGSLGSYKRGFIRAFEAVIHNPVFGGTYKWATLFLGYVNTVTWPSRLEEFWIWDSKIWSRVPRDSDSRMTVLARTSSNSKWQNRLLVRETASDKKPANV
jgi:hypothetical protein